MKNIFEIKNYNVEKKSFKDGITDMISINKKIIFGYKQFLFMIGLFFIFNIIKDASIINFYQHAGNFKEENSLLLSGEPNFNFVLNILGFLSTVFFYIFSIKFLADFKSFNLKIKLKESLFKIIDYKIYVFSFLFLFFSFLSLKVSIMPFFNKLPDYITMQQVSSYFETLFVYIASENGVEKFDLFLATNPVYPVINDVIQNLTINDFAINLIIGVIIFVISFAYFITSITSIIINKRISFFDTIKSSFVLIFKNQLYVIAASSSFLLFFIFNFLLSYYFDFNNSYYYSIASLYYLYISSQIVSINIEEKIKKK